MKPRIPLADYAALLAEHVPEERRRKPRAPEAPISDLARLTLERVNRCMASKAFSLAVRVGAAQALVSLTFGGRLA